MIRSLIILMFSTLIVKYSYSQILNPCQLKKGTQYGDTIITFYPNCNDTTTYIQRSYSKDGIIWRNESYRNNLLDGISWFTSSQNEGTQSNYYEKGKETKRIFYYPNSGIPYFIYEYINDSLVYENYFYPTGNPQSIGYAIIDSIGVHQNGKWIEYDSLGYSYWIGNYIPTHIEQTDTVVRDVGETLFIITVTREVKNSIWRKYDSNGKEIETIIYKEGIIIKKE